MGRDLLYKPPVPIVAPDEQADGKKPLPAPSTNKLGLPQRGRDLGGTQDAPAARPAKSTDAPAPPSTAPPPSESAPATERQPAFKSPYFTQDVQATAQVNLRAKPMQALRGAEGASDLRKVVLTAADVDGPDPTQLRAASDLMGLDSQAPPQLAQILQRQATWLRDKQVTLELLQGRMAHMQHMVAARLAALARMSRLPKDRLQRSATLQRAAEAQGADPEEIADISAAGDALTSATSKQADAMHRHLAKALGIKRK